MRQRPFRGPGQRERGASLVEFALVAPLLFILIFAVIDFSYNFSQRQDVRHGAREGARLAVVDYTPPGANACSIGDSVDGDGVGGDEANEADAIRCEVRARTGSLNDDETTVRLRFNGTSIGDTVDVRVCYPGLSVTGFFQPLLSNLDLQDTVQMRLEQVPAAGLSGNDDTADFTCP